MLNWATGLGVIVGMLDHISVIDYLSLFESPFEDVDVGVVLKLHLKLLMITAPCYCSTEPSANVAVSTLAF